MDAFEQLPVHELLREIVCVIVDHPEDVTITEQADSGGVLFAISVHPSDTGKLIGRQGRTAKSIRMIVAALGMKRNMRFLVVVEDLRASPPTPKPSEN